MQPVRPPPRAPLVDVISAQPVASVQRFTLPGETAAWHTSTIYARVNGYVAQVVRRHRRSREEGPGDGADRYTGARRRAGCGARAARACRMRRSWCARPKREFAQDQYERWRDSPKGVVSEQEREQKRASTTAPSAQFKCLRGRGCLEQGAGQSVQGIVAVQACNRPYDGVITARDIDIGNLVTAGKQTTGTTPLYVMTQNNPMRVFVDVPQSAAADLIQGAAPVTVQSSDGAQRSYTGNGGAHLASHQSHARARCASRLTSRK